MPIMLKTLRKRLEMPTRSPLDMALSMSKVISTICSLKEARWLFPQRPDRQCVTCSFVLFLIPDVPSGISLSARAFHHSLLQWGFLSKLGQPSLSPRQFTRPTRSACLTPAHTALSFPGAPIRCLMPST